MNFKKATLAAIIGAALTFGIWELFKDFINIKNQETSYVGKIDELSNTGFPDRVWKTDDKEFQLSKTQTKVTFVHFWASWCSPCIDEFPSLVRLAQDFSDDLTIIAVSLDENLREYEAFLKSLDISSTENFIIVREENYDYASSVGTEKLPETYILDENKKLIRKVPREENWDSPNVREFVDYITKK